MFWTRLKSAFLLKPASAHELVGIQYLRAAAALMVVLYHLSGMMAFPKYLGRYPMGRMFEGGNIGVDVFFCLSGFIIVYIALDPSLRPTMGAVTFYKRRFARIVPFMWLVVIAYAALRSEFRAFFPFWSYVRAFTLFPVGAVEPNVIWTLRHEFLFYLVFGLTFLAGARWLFVLYALSPLALMAVGLEYGPGSGGWSELLGFLFSRVDLLFGMGVLVGVVFVKTREKWPSITFAPLGMFAVLAVIFCLSAVWRYERTVTWQVVVIGLLSCAALALACVTPHVNNVIGDLGRRLGDASYCIYLTHTALVSTMLGFLAHFARGLPVDAIFGVTFLAVVVSATFLHYLVERPVVAWSQRLIFPRKIVGR